MMIRRVLMLSFAFAWAGITNAATVDFTDGVYTNVVPFGAAPENPVVFTEVADGVTFTFTALNNLTGGARFQITDGDGTAAVDARSGIRVGGGGGSSLSFAFSASQDVVLDSYFTGGILPNGNTSSFFLNADNLTFSVFDPFGTLLSGGNSMSASASHVAFADAPIAMEMGLEYSIVFSGTGAAVQSFLKEINFTPAGTPPVAEIPIPAAWLLFASGLMGLAGLRKRALA